jgi:hypothetical protein
MRLLRPAEPQQSYLTAKLAGPRSLMLAGQVIVILTKDQIAAKASQCAEAELCTLCIRPGGRKLALQELASINAKSGS